MEKNEQVEMIKFLIDLRCIVKEHPDWLPDIITHACRGSADKVEEERQITTNMYTAISLLYEHQYDKLNKGQKKTVLNVLLECPDIKGCEFEQQVKDRLERLEEKG